MTDRDSVLARVKSGDLEIDEGVRLLTGDGAAPAPPSTVGADDLGAAAERYVAALVSKAAQIAPETIAPRRPFEDYGFDSVLALDVVRAIEADFGKLAPTLLFEHQTVAALAAHLAGEHEATARAVFGAGANGASGAPGRGPKPAGSEEQAPAADGWAPRAGEEHARADGGRTQRAREPIAVVGISGRFPEADDLDELWENLAAGRDCISEIPAGRWDYREHFDPRPGVPGKSYTRWGGFLRAVDEFDAAFFNISPREAERMDPQERLFLEEAWRALEDAGSTRDARAGRQVGVYVGVMYSQYQLLQAEQALQENPLHLGSSYASIANRVSYALDLRGPSMAVDSMCSSSLTAIQLACDALASGTIDVAVAGGVNLSIHPAKFVDLSQGRFASTDGRCRSFGEGGDGYVPGEGVGAVVLRRLQDAEADGDRIHAVIRGGAIGHGGKTNGYSVPNPVEQTRVVEQALARAGVEPGAVSYVEAHGTGTSLGDPIEIASLQRAIGPRPEGAARCAVGSVKSNIGHLESAAGFAGLAKIVLQLRHGKLAPSLHSAALNPHLDLAATSLAVQRELESWEIGGDLRIAGLSSFGAGGANAHLVVSEHPAPAAVDAGDGPQLVVLSARTAAGLRTAAVELAAVAEHHRDEPGWLARAAHSLRVGRDAMEERLALVAGDAGELASALAGFAGGSAGDRLLRGSVDLGEGGAPAGDDLAVGGNPPGADELERIARRWIEGADVDWSRLSAPGLVKVTLPGHPFERERFWPEVVAGGGRAGAAELHPLLHANLSVPGRQRFATTLRPSDALVCDHAVGGRHMLPAAALIELARAAGEHSGLGEQARVASMVFEAPVVVEAAATELRIDLEPDDRGLRFEVLSGPAGDDRLVHARGRLDAPDRVAAPEHIDLGALRDGCAATIGGADCYARLSALDLDYGPSLRVVGGVDAADGHAIGHVALAESGAAGYRLHPALLEGAFHTLLAFDGGVRARVPFSVEAVELLAPALPAACQVHAVSRSAGDGAAQVFDLTLADEDGLVVARVEGLVVREPRDLAPAAGPAPRDLATPDEAAPRDGATPDVREARDVAAPVVLRPGWRASPVTAAGDPVPGTVVVLDDDGGVASALADDRGFAVVPCRRGLAFEATEGGFALDPSDPAQVGRLLEEVVARGPLAAVVHVSAAAAADDDPGAAIDSCLHPLLALARAISAAGAQQLHVLHVYAAAQPAPAHRAIAALLRTLATELPGVSCVNLGLGAEDWAGDAAQRVAAELRHAGARFRDVRVHSSGTRLEAELREDREAPPPASGTLRHEGVYVVTGGLGGLGRALARHLASTVGARLVLSGRSALDRDGERFLDELRDLGGKACYVQGDCSEPRDAEAIVAEAKRRFERLDGVFHLAGVLRDGLLARKRRVDADAVLAPKIGGALALDAATRDEPLELFVLFSSASSVMGIAGQGDYAYANAFLNELAGWRERQRAAGTRSGRTIAIAWPLWEGGGMGVDAATRERIARDLGWIALPAATGMRLLEDAIAGEGDRRAIFHGHRDLILRALEPAGSGARSTASEPSRRAAAATAPPVAATTAADGAIAGATRSALRRHLGALVAAQLKLPVERLDTARRFEYLGLESVMVMELTRELETIFGELPTTLFFEYQTVDDVCDHLAAAYPAASDARFASAASAAPATSTTPPRPVVASGEVSAPPESPPAARAPALRAPARDPREDRDEPIAIVGLSGRYPMAATVDELWRNLRDGRDCIVEVPASRWDHDRWFDPASGEPGTSYSRWGGFIDGVDEFDPRFFNIAPREARRMDPQERLFLETAWHAVEDAGYSRAALSERAVGVFVGVMYAQYQLYGADPAMQARGFVPSSLSASVANRVSHTLDLHGPSIAVDTMCSSSLTALHLACAAIRLGDCDEAIAGGVNAILHPNRYLQLSQGRFASTDGRCRSFGEGGDGYVPGEGVGAVLLKRLSRAEADGDHVYGTIRGSAINHGGRSNGYTVPTPVGQAAVIERALRAAGIDGAEIGYVEAHGTGTALGDPIEIDALTRAFGRAGSPACPIGSVKSNIGHLESAAGIAGVTKVLLQLRHGELVPSLHAEPPNPNIRFGAGPFEVQRELAPWPAPPGDARIAAVSSFGAGGANAHVIIAEHRAPAPIADEPGRPELVVLSARTPELLREAAGAIAGGLQALVTATTVPAAEVAAAVAEILGVEAGEVDPDDELESIGVDTHALAALADALARTYDVRPGTQLLLELGSARAVAAWIAQSRPPVADCGREHPRLRDVAFTLAVGREPQAERLAVVAGDLDDLCAKLRGHVAGESPDGVLCGRVAGETRGPLASVLAGERGAAFVRAIRDDGDLKRLAALWVSGVDLGAALADSHARRVSLPPTPFARDRFWVPDVAPSTGGEQPVAAAPPADPPAPVAGGAEAAGPPADLSQTTSADVGEAAPAPQAVRTPEADVQANAMEAMKEADVQATVMQAMSEVLEVAVAELDLDTAHSDLGVDSVLAVEIVDRIALDLGVEFKPTDFFSFPTVRALARNLAELVPAPAPASPAETSVPRGAAPASASAPASPAAEAAPRVAPAPAATQGPPPATPAPRVEAPAPAAPPEAPADTPAPRVAAVSASHAEVSPDDVAVIGMAGRFPGARDLDDLWDCLLAGRDLVGEIPAERWDVGRHFDPDGQAPGKTYSKWGSVLEDVDRFDPDFFGISPREARLMDPQQRLVLMEGWHALEDAGYADTTLDGTDCHVFLGTAMGDYHHLLKAAAVPIEGYTFMGTHPAVLASRLSYHLNLRGPSLAVDTSCSSSLMAVHLACEAIRGGQAQLAIAGGVAALTTPELHVLASKAGMLSPTGRCRPFDEAADGFVPGEGVGVVVLKRLADALRDGDHVHGVIAGSGANQDGRTNGLTAPSAPAQAALESAVYERFGIDPARIGYVECHGTGTKLGDPIEIEALHAAFGAGAGPRTCALGSIKSNLGHTLTAAGVAGLLKTLLCLRHGTLVPTVHLRSRNRYIAGDDSPFYVSDSASAWPRPGDGSRFGAVSSFGFSGTNVHAVVREAPPAAPRPPADERPRIFPVSAKTAPALEARLRELARWLAADGARHELRDIAHTLAAGRSHFAVRAAFVACDAAELRGRIDAWHGGATPDADGPPAEVVRRYLDGERIDWSSASPGDDGRVVPMPGYPFADERYWIPGSPMDRASHDRPPAPATPPAPAPASATPPAPASATPPAPATKPLAPGEEAVIAHRLTPSEPLVADHVVDGKPLLPAAGHLSLVHRALRDVLGDGPLVLRRVVWLRPVFVTEDCDLEVVLTALDDDRCRFAIRSRGANGETREHSRGEARREPAAADPLALAEIAGRCPQAVTPAEHYDRFEQMGILYDGAFRTVRHIDVSPSEAVATLEQAAETPVLPAGVVDGAIQTVASLPPYDDDQRPHVPFTMDEIRILRPIPRSSRAWIRLDKPGECTIAIADPDGRVCVAIDGMAYRELPAPVAMRVYEPTWCAAPGDGRRTSERPTRVLLLVAPDEPGLAPLLAQRHPGAVVETVQLDDRAGSGLRERLAALPPPDRLYHLGGLSEDTDPLDLDALERAQELTVRSLLRLVHHLVANDGADREVEIVCVTANALAVRDGDRVRPAAAGLFGLTRSLAKEYPRWRVGCLDIDLDELHDDPGAVAEAVAREPGHETGDEVALRAGVRRVRALVETAVDPPARSPFRDGGTYVILGGAGGIGAELATHLARRARANVALLGRRPRDARIDAALDAVQAAGGRADYHEVDATDEAAMTAALQAVKAHFGAINGVFHSALVLRDARLDAMSEETFDDVLAPKVRGSVVLARALRDEPLDFLVFFSSAQSFSGNAGQANYAAACTFKDAFASRLAGDGVPVHVVNWGYWGEVGVVATAGYRRRMQAIGVHSIGVEEGMAALEAIIGAPIAQAVPLKVEDRVLEKFGVVSDERAPASAAPEWAPIAAQRLGDGPDCDRLLTAHRRLDELGAALLVRAVQELGALRDPGDARPVRQLAAQLGVAATHEQLWEALVEIVVAAGFAERRGPDLLATEAVSELARRDLRAEREQLARSHPEVAAHTELLAACMSEYPRVLRGERAATEVMFPDSSMQLVEGVYRGDPLADRLNEIVAQGVAEHVERAGERPLRVLEVGAGTGGTTARTLAALAAFGDRVQYVYTDLSVGFLRHGKRAFAAEHPFVRFERLDIARPVAEQGFDTGGFDVVVAANVLHATADLRRTLGHVATLLREGGWLLLSETTAFSPFATLTFGLLDGWWAWRDGDLRIAGSPLADVPTWQTLLAETGFARSVAYAPARARRGAIGQHVLVAELGDRAPEPPAVASDRPAAPVDGDAAAPRVATDAVADVLTHAIAETLGRSEDDLDPDRVFTDYGVDSIILVELVNTVNDRLGIELRTTALFDHPTLAELIAHVEAEHGGHLHIEAAAPAPAAAANGNGNGNGGPPAMAADAVADVLTHAIAETLGRSEDDLDPDRVFTDYGVDSIILVELVNTVNERLGIELRTTALFDHPTLAELIAHVEAEYDAQIEPAGADAGGDLELLARLAAGEVSADELYARLEHA